MGTKREKHTLSTPPGLWQQWEGFAAERGLSVADYLRRAEEAYRPAGLANKLQEAIQRVSARGGLMPETIIQKVADQVLFLSPEMRMELLEALSERICLHCGDDQPLHGRCNCMRDE